MLDKDWNLLRLLVVLNEKRQTVLAAKHLRLSQPTISVMLKKLREDFNDKLFIRNKNHLEPTAKCEEILAQIPDIFEGLDNLYNDHSTWDISSTSGEIQLFLPAPLIDIIAPPLLKTLCAKAPNLTIECAVWSTSTVQALEHNSNAWGVSYIPVHATKNLIEKHLCDDCFIFVMKKDHPLTSNRVEDLMKYPLCVTLMPGYPEGSRMEMLIKRYKIEKTVNVRLSDLNSMFKLLSNSNFIGTTSSLHKTSLPDDIRYEPLPSKFPPRPLFKPLSFFASQRNNANPLSNWLYREIKMIVKQLGAE